MIPRTDRPTLRFYIEGLLRSNRHSTVIAIHFRLFGIIQSNYKLRAQALNLEAAIDACQASISISDLVLIAFDADEKQRISLLNSYSTSKKYPITLLRPRHIGYQQYSIILKKQKNLPLRSEVLAKHDIEGWGQGVITL
jgi:hypothetical protein